MLDPLKTPRKSIRTLDWPSRRALGAVMMVVGGLAAGCASSSGPRVLPVSGAQYAAAFDAAVETARRNRLPSVLRDRRGGVIETEPAIAGSILEPWKGDNASLTQALDHTVHFERRRARFEFLATGFDPGRAAAAGSAEPDLVGDNRPFEDLTRHPGPLELRVTVILERAHSPTLRLDDWTLIKATSSPIIPSNEQLPPVASTYWTAVGRDQAMERRLLDEVGRVLSTAAPGP